MSTEYSSKITFTFNGNAPENWKSALSNQRAPSWIDPQSSGSLVLQDILRNTGINTDSLYGNESLVFSFPSQRDVLSELLGICAVSDARILLIAAMSICRSLSGVVVTTQQLLTDGSSVSYEQKAVRNMYFMTQNGICIQADFSVNLSSENLPGARFFSSEEDLEVAGLERWGENGGEAWRAIVTIIDGRKVLMNGFGNVLELGDAPEERINSLSNESLERHTS